MIRIGIDLDNTIFDTEPVYKRGFRGTKYKYHLPTTWEVSECYPKEVSDNLFRLFKGKFVYKTKLLNKDLPVYLNNIIENSKKYKIYFITSRLGNMKPIKRKNIVFESHVLYYTYKQLKKAGFKTNIQNIKIVSTRSKLQALRDLKIDVMIDDGPHIIEECIKNKIKFYMISTDKTLYNHYLRKKVEWYNSLKECLEHFIKTT